MELTKGLFAVMVTGAIIKSTMGRPIQKHVWVQCGENSCDIKRQYCYQGNECFPCNEAVCNTPNFDDGALIQCYFYCNDLDRSTLQVSTIANDTTSRIAECSNSIAKTKKAGMIKEIFVYGLIPLATFGLGAAAMKLCMWYQNKRSIARNNNNDRQAFPVLAPQGKHSGNLDPGQSAKLLVSTAK